MPHRGEDLAKLSNPYIAKMLREVAAAYEVRGEDYFRVRAYDNAADSIEHATSEVKDLWESGQLQAVPGIGGSIAGHLDEFFRTGKVKHFEEAKKGLPLGMFEFLGLEGIGPKTAYRLAKELNLKTINELRKAAESGAIERLPGFKEKTAKQILKAIEEHKEGEGRMLLPIAYATAGKLTAEIMNMPGVERADPMGSLRRMVSTIGDIDIGVATSDPKGVVDAFTKLPDVGRVLAAGEAKATVLLKTGRQVDIYALDPQGYGSLLQYFTGSKQHNIHLRVVANRQGYSLSEHGIAKFKGGRIAGKPVPIATEEEFYRTLKMPWIPPELREDDGEIEAALANSLPKLVELGDIWGDIHIHTNNSDGEESLEEMVAAAVARGYKYCAVADHAPSVRSLGLVGAHGEIVRRRKEVERLQKKYEGKLTIFFSGEIDITAEAELELPDKLMALYDFTTASIHSSFGQSKEQMTRRIINALHNPYVKVIGHPTGRLLGKREAYDVDWESVFAVVAKEGKFLEINAFPTRLDLPDALVREAKEAGVRLVINTDAHHSSQFGNMRFGVAVARRGWCERTDIINTLSVREFARAIGIKSQEGSYRIRQSGRR